MQSKNLDKIPTGEIIQKKIIQALVASIVKIIWPVKIFKNNRRPRVKGRTTYLIISKNLKINPSATLSAVGTNPANHP